MKRRRLLVASSVLATVAVAGCGSPDDEDGDDGGGDDAYDLDGPKQSGPREGFGSRDDVRDGVHPNDPVEG